MFSSRFAPIELLRFSKAGSLRVGAEMILALQPGMGSSESKERLYVVRHLIKSAIPPVSLIPPYSHHNSFWHCFYFIETKALSALILPTFYGLYCYVYVLHRK